MRSLCDKYLSDSPTPEEKGKAYIVMLETALKLAKGEIKL